MRILLFTPSYPPRVGGLEGVTERLARELVTGGHRVCVVTKRYPKNLPAHECNGGIEIRRMAFPTLIPERRPLRWRQRIKAALMLPTVPFTIARLARLLTQFGADVVNVHYFSNPAVSMIVAASLKRRPLVLSFHGSDLANVPYPANWSWTVRWACRAAESLTVCSDDLYMRLKELTGRSAVVAHNGIDCRPHGRDVPEQNGAILVISRLVEKKGIDTVLRSAALLAGERPGPVPQFVIAGAGPLQGELEALAKDLNVVSFVEFVGNVDPYRIPSLLAAAKFLVVPSHWEAFGVVCLEAMAAGRAVIGTNAGGIPGIVIHGETGLLVPPGDSRALADAIANLLDNPAQALRMGERGRKRALAHFTWEKTCHAYLEAYSLSLTSSRKPTVLQQGVA